MTERNQQAAVHCLPNLCNLMQLLNFLCSLLQSVQSVKTCKQVSQSEMQFYSSGGLQLEGHLLHDNLHMALPGI